MQLWRQNIHGTGTRKKEDCYNDQPKRQKSIQRRVVATRLIRASKIQNDLETCITLVKNTLVNELLK